MGPYYDFNQQYMSQLPSGNPMNTTDTGGDFLSTLGGIVSGVPIIGSLIGGALNLWGQHRQNKHQMEMWEKTNEYNSPAAMMERMKAAGINPNAAAQGITGAPAAGAASMPQAAQSPDLSSIGAAVGNSVNNALSYQAQKAQIENIQADTKLKQVNATGREIQNQYDPSIYEQTITNLYHEGKINEHQAEILRSFADNADAFRTLELQELGKRIQNYEKEWQKIESDIKRNESEIGLNGVQAALMAEQKKYWEQVLSGLTPGTPEYALAQCAQQYGTDSKEYRMLYQAIKDVKQAQGEGQFESNPAGKHFATVAAYKDELVQMRQAADAEYRKAIKMKASKDYQYSYVKKKAVDDAVSYWRGQLDMIQNRISSADKDYRKSQYQMGYATWWQDAGQKAVNIIPALAGFAVGKGKGIKK